MYYIHKTKINIYELPVSDLITLPHIYDKRKKRPCNLGYNLFNWIFSTKSELGNLVAAMNFSFLFFLKINLSTSSDKNGFCHVVRAQETCPLRG